MILISIDGTSTLGNCHAEEPQTIKKGEIILYIEDGAIPGSASWGS